MELFDPWPEGYTINRRSPYGPRVHPITGRRTFHHGLDAAMPVGTQLTAPADGVVVHKGNSASGGFTLILKHADNFHTVYYHLQKASPLPIGAKVLAGAPIASSGNTGASTGPHLHWELRRSQKWGDTLDPVPYMVGPYEKPAEPTARPEPVEPTPRPEPVVPSPRPPLLAKPITPKLARFFQMRRGLK